MKQFIEDNKTSAQHCDGIDQVIYITDLEAYMEGKVVVDADWLKKLWNMAETHPVLKYEIESMIATQEGE